MKRWTRSTLHSPSASLLGKQGNHVDHVDGKGTAWWHHESVRLKAPRTVSSSSPPETPLLQLQPRAWRSLGVSEQLDSAPEATGQELGAASSPALTGHRWEVGWSRRAAVRLSGL